MTDTNKPAEQEKEKAKPKATAGTRKGNGAGWGGPAKGAGRVVAGAAAFQKGNKAAAKDRG